jgi:hypothetical protein
MKTDKQAVEEMAKVIEQRCNRDCIPSCDECIAQTLYKAGYRKQGEWISVEDKLPEDVYGKDRKQITVLVCTKRGTVRSSSRIKVRMVHFNREMQKLENTDIFDWNGQLPQKVTHWMPLPEPPKMKGGE